MKRRDDKLLDVTIDGKEYGLARRVTTYGSTNIEKCSSTINASASGLLKAETRFNHSRMAGCETRVTSYANGFSI